MDYVKLYHAQASEVLPSLHNVDLIYMDPLFNTGDTFTMLDGPDVVAFEDRFEDDVAFTTYLRSMLLRSHEALAPHGSCVVHCSSAFQPLVRVLGESIFSDPGGFVDQIVWHYRRWPTRGRKLNNLHDYLIRFTKGAPHGARFNQLYQPLAESTQKTWGTKKQNAVRIEGRRLRSESTTTESEGAPMGDVWTDIGILAPSSNERNGYPTQKPEKLLRRIIDLYSDPGDLVVDPTMGSGTTVVAALACGRNAIGIDESSVAYRVATERVEMFIHRGNNDILFEKNP